MKSKNKKLIFLIALILVALLGLLALLRQVLSEEQMKKMVVEFVAKELPGAQGDLAAVHLNFRRTLQVHFDELKISKGEELEITAEHVVLSIPYGNFIFRSGKFDLRIDNPVVKSEGGTTSFGVLRTIELLKSVPEVVGLKGEVNAKLYKPSFIPEIQILDFYQPEINRLVVNNIGRNHEMAIEVLGELSEDERRVPYSLIGSFNLDAKTIQASLATEILSLPFKGYRVQNIKLKLLSSDQGLKISGSSEDLVELEGIWNSELAEIDISKLFVPIEHTPLSPLYGEEAKGMGLSLRGSYADASDELELFDSHLPLTLGEIKYQSQVTGAVTPHEGRYEITFVVPNQEGKLELNFKEGALNEIVANLTGFDLSPLEDHELVKKIKTLYGERSFDDLLMQVGFENSAFERYQIQGSYTQGDEGKVLQIKIPDSKALFEVRLKDEKLTIKMVNFPCDVIALILKKKSPGGICGGDMDYNYTTEKGSFNLNWEPDSGLTELKTLLSLSMVGALEQVWNVKGIIDGDKVKINRLGGRRFRFVGNAIGSISNQNIKLDGLLTFKKKRISPIRIEISTEGVRQLNEDENAN